MRGGRVDVLLALAVLLEAVGVVAEAARARPPRLAVVDDPLHAHPPARGRSRCRADRWPAAPCGSGASPRASSCRRGHPGASRSPAPRSGGCSCPSRSFSQRVMPQLSPLVLRASQSSSSPSSRRAPAWCSASPGRSGSPRSARCPGRRGRPRKPTAIAATARQQRCCRPKPAHTRHGPPSASTLRGALEQTGRMAATLIITADDFGYHPRYDAGILEAAAAGGLDAVSVMALRLDELPPAELRAAGTWRWACTSTTGGALDRPAVDRAVPPLRGAGGQDGRLRRRPPPLPRDRRARAGRGGSRRRARPAVRSVDDEHRRALRSPGCAPPTG